MSAKVGRNGIRSERPACSAAAAEADWEEDTGGETYLSAAWRVSLASCHEASSSSRSTAASCIVLSVRVVCVSCRQFESSVSWMRSAKVATHSRAEIPTVHDVFKSPLGRSGWEMKGCPECWLSDSSGAVAVAVAVESSVGFSNTSRSGTDSP